MRIKDLSRKYAWIMPIISVVLLLLTSCGSPPESTNPLEKAFASGKPTIAEFGGGTCLACKLMTPIMFELSLDYEGKLNVVMINVDEYMALTDQYGIMTIPTQIIFDTKGNKLASHIGFWLKEDIITQLKAVGIE
jgi:thioredoxin 1